MADITREAQARTNEIKQLTTNLQDLGVDLTPHLIQGGSAGGQVLAGAVNDYLKTVILSGNIGSFSLAALSQAVIVVAPIAFLAEGIDRIGRAQAAQSLADTEYTQYLSDRIKARAVIDDYINKIIILKKIRDDILATKYQIWDLQHIVLNPVYRPARPEYQTYIKDTTIEPAPEKRVWIPPNPASRLDKGNRWNITPAEKKINIRDRYKIPDNTSILINNDDYKLITTWMLEYIEKEPNRPITAQNWRASAPQFLEQLASNSLGDLNNMYNEINASYNTFNLFNAIIEILKQYADIKTIIPAQIPQKPEMKPNIPLSNQVNIPIPTPAPAPGVQRDNIIVQFAKYYGIIK